MGVVEEIVDGEDVVVVVAVVAVGEVCEEEKLL